jgi:hypothetical protein
MSEVTELIAAIAAIAKDPEGWVKRLGDVKAAGDKLAEARAVKKDADKTAEQASAERSSAAYDRGQAERAMRNSADQATANERRSQELDRRERQLEANERAALQAANNLKANQDSREADLTAREAIAAKKLRDAQALMANYDEAKHRAAEKLAS